MALLAVFGRYVSATVRSDSQQETSDTVPANSANKVVIITVIWIFFLCRECLISIWFGKAAD